jgi:hypothetical protein
VNNKYSRRRRRRRRRRKRRRRRRRRRSSCPKFYERLLTFIMKDKDLYKYSPESRFRTGSR